MVISTISHQQPQKIKKKRNLPGNPDPDAEVIALSPETLMATNRFVCEVCNKGFKRDQNLQLHRRGHNLPWKLKKQRILDSSREFINGKKVYVCPEPSCVHHHPSRALGDLTGIKKHFFRKHGEKKWKCEKCSKIYAVQSDWKAHSKICGTREYKCDCGTIFSRKDSFITHRAFCDALAEETARLQFGTPPPTSKSNYQTAQLQPFHHLHPHSFPAFSTQQLLLHNLSLNPWTPPQNPNPNLNHQNQTSNIKPNTTTHFPIPPPPPTAGATTSAHLSATALLQKAATIGAQPVGQVASTMTPLGPGMPTELLGFPAGGRGLTRDFLGLTRDCGGGGGGRSIVNVSMNMKSVLSFTGSVESPTFEIGDQSLLKAQGSGFAKPPASEMWGNC